MPLEQRDRVKLSKFMAKVLRHRPELLDLTLDPEGWCDLDEFLAKANKKGWKYQMTREHIEEVIANDDKKRYEILDNDIRACQGHTTNSVDITFEQVEPPEFLYHGTARSVVDAIMQDGLKPMQRHYVHLSIDQETAQKVGRRRDRNPTILKVLAGKAHRENIPFFISPNGVYLVKNLPSEYLEK